MRSVRFEQHENREDDREQDGQTMVPLLTVDAKHGATPTDLEAQGGFAVFQDVAEWRHCKIFPDGDPLSPEVLMPEGSCKYGDNLALLVCAYNEEAEEMRATLNAVARQQEALEKVGISLKVLVVFDGWAAVSQSMRDYIASLFPPVQHDDWHDLLEKSDGTISVVLGKRTKGGSPQVHTAEGLSMSILIKGGNRKKYDSLQCFFRGFVPSVKSEFAFSTDCGSSFESDALAKMVKYMQEHPSCVGATGNITEQPVMGNAPFYLRADMTCLLEMRNKLQFELMKRFGYVHIIPGPCSMWRAYPTGIKDVLDISEAITKSSKDIVTSNLVLNDDVLLCFSGQHVKLTDDSPSTLGYVPDAECHFEAEALLHQHFVQQRRWHNGGVGYNFSLIFSSPTWMEQQPRRNRACVKLFHACQQLAGLLFTPLVPAMFWCCSVMVWGPKLLKDSGLLPLSGVQDSVPDWCTCEVVLAVTHIVLFGFFMLLHHSTGKPQTALLWFITIMNAVFVVVTLIWQMEVAGRHFLTVLPVVLPSDVAFTVVPYVVMCLLDRDWSSMGRFFCSYPVNILIAPTFQGWFYAGYLSQLHVISWGNRPDPNARLTGQVHSLTVTLLVMLANAGIVLAFAVYSPAKMWPLLLTVSLLRLPWLLVSWLSVALRVRSLLVH